MKPGFKTTEFWVTIFLQLVGMLATLGLFTPDQADAVTTAIPQIGGVVTMLGSAFGYQLSRGSAKKNNGGFSKFILMAVLFAFSLVVLFGCATFDKMFPPPPEPVCDRPEAAESVICKEFRERSLEPEQYQDLILDAVAIGALVEPQAVAMAKRFLARVRMGLTQNPLLTLGELFTWVQNNEQYYKAIASIFSRRLPWALEVDELLTPFDLWLIEEHLKNIEELL